MDIDHRLVGLGQAVMRGVLDVGAERLVLSLEDVTFGHLVAIKYTKTPRNGKMITKASQPRTRPIRHAT